MPSFFFSDICGTLYKVNTSYCFLAFYFRRNNRIKGVYFRLLLSFPVKVVWKLAGAVMDMEWLRKYLLGLLKGESEEAVVLEAKAFVREVLPRFRIKAAWEKINPDIPLVLVSATLSPLAKAIAAEMGAEAYFATEMEVKDGIYTGRIASDVRGEKLVLLYDSPYDSYLSQSCFMTDNPEDLPLVKAVKDAIIVTKSYRHRQFWAEQQVPVVHFLKS